MSQAQIAELYGRSVSVISRHITAILEEGELEAESTIAKIATVRLEGGRAVERWIEHYNIDMVISVGYRVSSAKATIFRRWATQTLVQFAAKGFVIDAPRLKRPENRDRVAELKEIIRDIRSDEANVYRELKAICRMCQDYSPNSGEWQEFYRNTQAKLIYAVCSNTLAEIVKHRADAREENMGLRTWENDNIRKSDVGISKNYLAQAEIKELNRLTTILLDIFEDQADVGRLTLMAEAAALLDRQLASLGRTVLKSGGRVAMTDAKTHAGREYEKFKAKLAVKRHEEADRAIGEIKKMGKELPRQ